MTVSPEEARKALAEITEARGTAERVQRYGDAAPFMMLWGSIWLIANVASQFSAVLGRSVWRAGLIVGTIITLLLIVSQSRRRGARMRQAGEDPRVFGRRMGLIGAALFVFIIGSAFILGPLDARRTNAFISLFWASIYMGAGAWVGLRLVITGAVTAAATLFGFLAIHQYFPLWMGIVAGGGLIVGGWWLRRI
jgi:hypothetical protein